MPAMKKIHLVFFILVAFTFGALLHEAPLFTAPKNWPKPVYDLKKNPLSRARINLGRVLFYDPILSRDSTISCNSCHSQYTAFAHVDHALSHGIDNRIGTRNAPALMNLAWMSQFMWDGAINHLDMQALAPMSNPLEMDEKIQHVVQKMQRTKIYPTLFYQAFGDSAITGARLLKSISQFMITLVSSNSKYDSVMRHQAQFTTQELNGYQLFKKNCSACHTEPLYTNNTFQSNGIPVDTSLHDFGRVTMSHARTDSFLYKVPTLRNIEFSAPYMHDGRFKTLNAVLKHYTEGIDTTQIQSVTLKKRIHFNSNEKVDLIAFLITLSDRQFLFDTSYSYPKKILYNLAKD